MSKLLLLFFKETTHKNVARLVDSENLSKKRKRSKTNKKYAHTKSVAARLVDSENWCKNIFFIKKQQQHAHKKSVSILVDSENLSKKQPKQKNYYTHTQKVLLD